MTTSEPMSCCAMTLTASSTVPLGGVANSALPLMRRISLTSISASLRPSLRLLLSSGGRHGGPSAPGEINDSEQDRNEDNRRCHARQVCEESQRAAGQADEREPDDRDHGRAA